MPSQKSPEPHGCSIRRTEISLRARESLRKPLPGMNERALRSFPCDPFREALRNGRPKAVGPEEGSELRRGFPRVFGVISRFGKCDVSESVS